MNESFYKLEISELQQMKGKEKILLHSCCAPCSSHVISLLTNYADVTVIYYNPNIYPKEEYEKRKKEQIRLINEINKKHSVDFIDCDYENEIFQRAVKGYETCGEKGPRCTICFDLRLDFTAKKASLLGYDYFCSTLSVSPHKDAKVINEIGKKKEKEYKTKWLYSDFKKENGYKKSIELSKEYNLYRQNYCGCKYSIDKTINKGGV